MAITERKRIMYTAVVVVLLGIITGVLIGRVAMAGTPQPVKTFNVVVYHWGFAFFDQDWNEVDHIEVERGTRVRLVAFSAHTFSHEMAEKFGERVMERGIGDYGPGDPELRELQETAEENPDTANHGVSIAGLNVDLRPTVQADTVGEATDSVEFTTDAVGSFNIKCSNSCGYGHDYMVAGGALVVLP